jgi:hypothetical protein
MFSSQRQARYPNIKSVTVLASNYQSLSVKYPLFNFRPIPEQDYGGEFYKFNGGYVLNDFMYIKAWYNSFTVPIEVSTLYLNIGGSVGQTYIVGNLRHIIFNGQTISLNGLENIESVDMSPAAMQNVKVYGIRESFIKLTKLIFPRNYIMWRENNPVIIGGDQAREIEIVGAYQPKSIKIEDGLTFNKISFLGRSHYSVWELPVLNMVIDELVDIEKFDPRSFSNSKIETFTYLNGSRQKNICKIYFELIKRMPNLVYGILELPAGKSVEYPDPMSRTQWEVLAMDQGSSTSTTSYRFSKRNTGKVSGRSAKDI